MPTGQSGSRESRSSGANGGARGNGGFAKRPSGHAANGGISSLSTGDDGDAPAYMKLKRRLDDFLIQSSGIISEGATSFAAGVADERNIVGVGESVNDPRYGGPPGEGTLIVYTAERASADSIKGSLSNAQMARDDELDQTAMRVFHSGVIESQSHRFHSRPAPMGVSIGHVNVTAGTAGVLVRGRNGERRGRLMILSNNHVLAGVRGGAINHSILQPGRADNGVHPQHEIGVLERFVELKLGAGVFNTVDCATAWVDESEVRPELVYLENGEQKFFGVSKGTIAPQKGQVVGKSGRTTQVTQGWINATNVTVNVNYPGFGTGTFIKQFSVVALDGRSFFSQGGDSGSLIWTWNEQRNPVGLLFAGGNGVTFANPIDTVLSELDVELFVRQG